MKQRQKEVAKLFLYGTGIVLRNLLPSPPPKKEKHCNDHLTLLLLTSHQPLGERPASDPYAELLSESESTRRERELILC